MSEVILFNKPECPFCWRVRMVLHHLGLVADLRAFDDPNQEDSWRLLTPKGTVPVMQIDDLTLIDSTVMLEYLHDRYGQVWPETPAMRAKARTMVIYGDDISGAAVKTVALEKRGRAAALWNQHRIAAAMDEWLATFPYLSAQLGNNEYFSGKCGAADFALATRFALGITYPLRLRYNLRYAP